MPGDETESLVSQDMFVNAWMPLPRSHTGQRWKKIKI